MRIGKRNRLTLAAVTHRLKAVVASIDDELSYLDGLLSTPMADVVLSPSEWAAAEAARAKLEQTVRSLEADAVMADRWASDWHRRAAIAEREGRMDMVERARKRVTSAEAEHRAYVEEIRAAREFLAEWGSRVKLAERQGDGRSAHA